MDVRLCVATGVELIVAVFSDVHANLPALETFVEHVRGRADTYLCLGDTVNYGPWNDECLELIWSLPGIVMVEGNHEHLFLHEEEVAEQHPLVQRFYSTSRSWFTRADLIAGLPKEVALGSFTCTHTIGARRVFGDTDILVDRDYLIGHSHYQYRIERGGTIVNPGSVGQNRARIDHVEYALFDTDQGSFTFESVPYDFASFLKELRVRRYPQECLDYLQRKREQVRGDLRP